MGLEVAFGTHIYRTHTERKRRASKIDVPHKHTLYLRSVGADWSPAYITCATDEH